MSPEIYMTKCTVHHDEEPCADCGQALSLLHILREQYCKQQNVVKVDRQKVSRRPLIASDKDPRHQQVAHPAVNDQKSCKSVSVLVVADQRHRRDHIHQDQRDKVIHEFRESGEG